MHRALSTVLVSSAFGLAACGGDDGDGGSTSRSGDEAEITKVLQSFSVETDAFCGAITKDLLRRIWRTPAKCSKAERINAKVYDGKRAGRLDVTEIRVDGDTATTTSNGTTFELTVPPEDGSPAVTVPEHTYEGGVELRREDGRWKIAEIENGYLRPTVALTITATVFAISTDEQVEPDLIRETADCVAGRIEALDDDEERDLLHALASGDESARADYERASGYVGACLDSPDSQA